MHAEEQRFRLCIGGLRSRPFLRREDGRNCSIEDVICVLTCFPVVFVCEIENHDI